MSLRIRRITGEILCAAKHPKEEGDLYIDDWWQYFLAVDNRIIIPDADEAETGRHHWAVHQLLERRWGAWQA